MLFFRLHIVTDKEFRRRITQVQKVQRKLETGITQRLLRTAELYRRIAESVLGRPVNLSTCQRI